MTFDLPAAVLAMLEPVIETDPEKLRRWADNLDKAAAAVTATPGPAHMGDRYSMRATALRLRADRIEAS